MSEFLKSVRAFLYERTVSPLLGAFTVGWLLTNYRVVVILLSDENYSIKFEAIDAQFVSICVPISDMKLCVWGWLGKGILLPTFLALMYIYVYPRLAKPVFQHSLRKQTELRRIKQKEEGQRLLSEEESIELYKEIARVEEQRSADVKRHNDHVSGLNATINSLQNELSELSNNNDHSRITKEYELDSADPENVRQLIGSRITDYPNTEFALSDLFSSEEWSSFSDETRAAINEEGSEMIRRGEFPDVHATVGGSKRPERFIRGKANKPGSKVNLSEYGKRLLNMPRLREGTAVTAIDVAEELGSSLDEARLELEKLRDKGIVVQQGTSYDQELLYLLNTKGEILTSDKDASLTIANLDSTNVALSEYLVSNNFVLYFNPKDTRRGHKRISFGKDGRVLEGRNENEETWRVSDGMLELVQSDGRVHSRFVFDAPRERFVHTNDKDTLSLRDQYIQETD